jgi:hypothetical protein
VRLTVSSSADASGIARTAGESQRRTGANAQSCAIEIEISGAKDTLATKNDLVVLRAELRGEMAALSGGLRTEIAKQGGELRAADLKKRLFAG